MKPAAFLFDLDGTLVDTEALWTKAIVDFVVSRGGKTTYEEILPSVIGRNWLDIDRSLHDRFPEIGESSPMEDAVELRRFYDAYATNPSSMRIEGSIAFFRAVSKIAPCAIVSGSPHGRRVCRIGVVEPAKLHCVLHWRRFPDLGESVVQRTVNVKPVAPDDGRQNLFVCRLSATGDDEIDYGFSPERLGIDQGPVEIEEKRRRLQLTSPCRSTSCTSCRSRTDTGRCGRSSAPRAQSASRLRARRQRTSTPCPRARTSRLRGGCRIRR